MKITESMLRQFIREETQKLTNQELRDVDPVDRQRGVLADALNAAMRYLESEDFKDAFAQVDFAQKMNLQYLQAHPGAESKKLQDLDRKLKTLLAGLDHVIKAWPKDDLERELSDCISDLDTYLPKSKG